MKNTKFYDNKIIQIGLIYGLIGGIIMVFLRFVDFGLYYLHGFLFIANYLINMIVGLNIYNKSLQKKSTFLKRMITALFIYILTTITYVVITITFGKFNIESTSGDKLFLALISIALGLVISSILALLVNQERNRSIKY